MKGIKGWVGACLALVLTACGDGSVQSPDFTPELQSLTVTPTSFSLGTGEIQQLQALGTYSTPPGSSTSSTTRDVTSEVTWSSGTPAVATVNGTGEVTAVGAGTSVIRAELNGKSGTSNMTGLGVVLRQVIITPEQRVVAPRGTASYVAQGRYSDSETPRDITGSVIQWRFEPSSSLGTFNVTTGRTVIITAGNQTGEASVVASVVQSGETIDSAPAQFIVAQLTRLEVDPAAASQPVGDAQEFTAFGIYTSPTGSADPLREEVAATWAAAATADGATAPTLDAACEAGAASPTCLVTGRSEGTVNVTATFGGLNGTAVLTVTQPVLKAVQITPDEPNAATRTTPASLTLPQGSAQPLYALYYYSNAPSEPLISPLYDTDAVVWASSSTTNLSLAAAPNNSVVATAAAQGTSNVTATAGSINDSLAVTISAPSLQGIVAVRPSQAFVSVGRTVDFTAVGRFTDGDRDLPDADVTWTSDNAAATIDAAGIATGVSENLAGVTITATLKSNTASSATAKLFVTADGCTAPLLQSEGATTAVPPPVGICLTCGVSNAPFAIDADPLNFATINMPVGALNARQSFDVNAATTAPDFTAGSRAGFLVSRPTGTLVLAELLSQIELSTLKDSAVQESTSSLNPLRVDLLGMQLIGGPGEDVALVSMPTTTAYDGVRVSLISGGATAFNGINVFGACGTVEPPVVAASGISSLQASSTTVTTGNTVGILAYDYDDTSALLNGADIEWSSSDPAIATVNPNGVVTGVAPGTVEITATLRNTSICGTHCTQKITLIVNAAYCEAPLRAPEVTVSRDIAGLCLLCTVEEIANVIDASDATYGRAYLPIALLGSLGSVSVTVKSVSDQPTPLPAGQVGFLVSQPTNAVAVAEVLSQFQVSTLDANGAVIESSSSLPSLLRLDLLGLNVLGGRQGVISFPATKPYKALRLTFSPGVAGLLTQVNVNSACGTVSTAAP